MRILAWTRNLWVNAQDQVCESSEEVLFYDLDRLGCVVGLTFHHVKERLGIFLAL